MRISVIIPTYNRRQVIDRAIDSVLAQKRPSQEVIVVDDGSTDKTVSHLNEKYAGQIHVLESPHNLGVSAARNSGIAACNGDWIALLDSDDEWLPDKLNQQVTAMEQQPLEICHTDEIWIRNGVQVNQMNKHKKYGGDIFANCLAMCAMSPSSILIKKQLIINAGGFDESLPACEDYDLWLRLCADNAVLFVDQPLLKKYGGHADQLSRKHWGMDRFRIQALVKLLQTTTLSETQRQQTIETLLAKVRILHKGATKHNNRELIVYCEELQLKYL